MTSELWERTGTRASVRHALDEDTAALAGWLVNVCRKSDRSFDQIFIFRGPSMLSRVLRNNPSGEIKAVGMPDLRRVSVPQFHMLKKLNVVESVRGHWPGKWFIVNPDAIPASIKRAQQPG